MALYLKIIDTVILSRIRFPCSRLQLTTFSFIFLDVSKWVCRDEISLFYISLWSFLIVKRGKLLFRKLLLPGFDYSHEISSLLSELEISYINNS